MSSYLEYKCLFQIIEPFFFFHSFPATGGERWWDGEGIGFGPLDPLSDLQLLSPNPTTSTPHPTLAEPSSSAIGHSPPNHPSPDLLPSLGVTIHPISSSLEAQRLCVQDLVEFGPKVSNGHFWPLSFWVVLLLFILGPLSTRS